MRETIQIVSTPSIPPVPLYVYGPGSSSMDAAWDLLATGRLPVWGSLLLESQSAGRGRMGRVWQSPPGHVYAALRLPLAPPFDGPGASLALAFFLHEIFTGLFTSHPREAFTGDTTTYPREVFTGDTTTYPHETFTGDTTTYPRETFTGEHSDYGWNFELKWPNDLIFEGGKVGGILLESRGRDLVAGVGFNLVAPPGGEWRAERDPGAPPPTALPFSMGPVKLWTALVKQIIVLYNGKFGGLGMGEVAERAEKILLWRGRNVMAFQPASEPPAPEDPLRGRLAGLGPEGQLILENPRGLYALWSGALCLCKD